MDESLRDDALLLRYLDNSMEDTERRTFEFRLEQDAALRQRLEDLQVALEAVRQVGVAERVQRIHQEMMTELAEEPSRPAVPVRKIVRWGLAVAASVVFLVVAIGGWQLYRLTPDAVYEEHFTEYTVSTTRSVPSASSVVGRLYNERNYPGVLQASESTSLSGQDSLLVGLAYLHTGALPQAIRWLQTIERGGGAYRQDAQYYLSLAYLRERRLSEALVLMQQINNDPSHLYHQQVPHSLLRKVRLLKWK